MCHVIFQLKLYTVQTLLYLIPGCAWHTGTGAAKGRERAKDRIVSIDSISLKVQYAVLVEVCYILCYV